MYVKVDQSVDTGGLDDMFFIRVSIILREGKVMGPTQDQYSLSQIGEFPDHCFKGSISVSKGSTGSDISHIRQADIRMPVIQLVKLRPDSVRRMRSIAVPANASLFIATDNHQVCFFQVRKEFIVCID